MTHAFDSSYPRDLVGYGQHPPDPQWPGGAKIAVQFVLNYEEGAENNVLHGDEASETFLSEMVGAQPFPNRHMSMESIYEYGSRAGLWRVLRAFERRGLPLTIFAVAKAMQRNPEAVSAFRELGHEFTDLGNLAPAELRPLAEKALSPAGLAENGFFNAEYVGRMLTEHIENKTYHLIDLWSLLTFQVWFFKYVLKREI